MSYEVGTGGCTFLLQGTGRTSLEEVAALDLVAVLGLGEALHQLAVLVGDHHGAEVGEAGVQAGLGGQTANITSNSLKTLLRLNDSLVHVHHSLDSGDLGVSVEGLPLPSHVGQGHIGGEEEEEAEQSQERDDDGGEVEASLSSAIRGSTHTITLHRGAIALCWGAISIGLRGAIAIISPDSGARDSDSGE